MTAPIVHRYLVTVRLDACRTRDFSVMAPTHWSAGWLWRQLHPYAEVIAVRRAKEYGGDHTPAGRAQPASEDD